MNILENSPMENLGLGFSQRLRKAINDAGMSGMNNIELGKFFDVTSAQVGNWLKGDDERLPRVKKGLEIAEKLQISYEWLMTGNTSKESTGSPENDMFFCLFLESSEKVQQEIRSYAAYIMSRAGEVEHREILDKLLGDSEALQEPDKKTHPER